MSPQAASQRAKYEQMWESVEIRPEYSDQCDYVFAKAIKNKPRYDSVEAETNVPWQLIAGINMREASFNFKLGFHNGDPWNEVTTHRPKGRGPFESWEDSAIDALKLLNFAMIDNWDLPLMLEKAEKYNGAGYMNRGVPSPYLWSFTKLYTKGKFSADSVYDPELVDKQVGIAALFLRFQERNML